MAFNVNLYTFSKKENSTAQPAAAALVRTETAVIKQPSGIMEPVMRFTINGNPTACNYAYISEFGRYYFITDWTSEPGQIWTASMRVDPLASWKSYIGSQSFYVLRSSAEKDGDIFDAMYPAKDTFVTAIQANLNSPSSWWNLNTDPPETWADWVNACWEGYYIMGLLSYAGAGSLVGGVNYVAMIPAQFQRFLNVIFTDNSAQTVNNLPLTLGDVVGNAITGAVMSQTDNQNLAYIA